MLILKRKRDERIFLNVNGVEVAIAVTSLEAGSVSIGIEAPKEVGIWREEIYATRKNKTASESQAS